MGNVRAERLSGQAGPVRPLGNITESTPAQRDGITKSGPSQGRKSLESRQIDGRKLRYRMLDTAAMVLGPKSRVAACQKVPSYGVQQGSQQRGISKNADGRAFFHGVGACGNVWACPICSQKISESKRNEILAALRAHREAGGVALLATWTFAHTRNDVLLDMVKGFMKALSELKGRRAFKRVTGDLGYIGQIRALEVTHSNANGWHPHAHEIWFLDKAPTPEQLEEAKEDLYQEWRKYCLKHGLGEPSREHGFDLQYRENKGESGEDAVGAYVSKWGYELTYAHKKQGRQGGRSPWAILTDLTEKYTWHDAQLYREYCAAFKGRAQLFWSRGLKDRFEIEEVNDQELADRPEIHHVINVDAKEWNAIVYYKKHASVLEVAEREPLFLREYIRELVDRRQKQWSEKMQLKRKLEASTYNHMQEIGQPIETAA